MANRNFKRDRGALEQGIVDLFAQVAIGATGAPTKSAANSKGFGTITRSSAGKYVLNLSDVYQRLVHFAASVKLASGAPATSMSVQCIVRTDNSNGASPSITIEFVDATGAAIEIVSGATLLLKATLKNSTA